MKPSFIRQLGIGNEELWGDDTPDNPSQINTGDVVLISDDASVDSVRTGYARTLTEIACDETDISNLRSQVDHLRQVSSGLEALMLDVEVVSANSDEIKPEERQVLIVAAQAVRQMCRDDDVCTVLDDIIEGRLEASQERLSSAIDTVNEQINQTNAAYINARDTRSIVIRDHALAAIDQAATETWDEAEKINDLTEPMGVKDEAAVMAASQNLRQSHENIVLVEDVRQYLQDHRISMYEEKAQALRSYVDEQMIKDQLRVNPASVLVDDHLYNGPASIQYVDAGLEALQGDISGEALDGVIDATDACLKDLLECTDDYRRTLADQANQLMNLAKLIQGNPNQFSFNGQSLVIPPKVVAGLYRGLPDDPVLSVTCSNATGHVLNTINLMSVLKQDLIEPCVSYTSHLSNQLINRYGDWGPCQSKPLLLKDSIPWSVYREEGDNPTVDILADYGCGEALCLTGTSHSITPAVSAAEEVYSRGRLAIALTKVDKTLPERVSAPNNAEEVFSLISTTLQLTQNLNDGLCDDIHEMQTLVNQALAKINLAINTLPDQHVEYSTASTLALTAGVNVVSIGQLWRIKTINAICNAVRAYIGACAL